MCTNTGLQEIIKNFKDSKPITFLKDEHLFNENDESKGIYYIENGSVKISKKDHGGQDRIIYLATCGEILGLHPVVNNHNNPNTAIAISDTNTIFITANNFTNLIKSNNTYKFLVMKSLCSRIDSMEDHLIGLNEKMTEERFADTLLMLIDKYGLSPCNTIKINLSIDELASFTCTSKSYMKKIVSEFSSKGIINLSAETIKILDLSKLKNILTPV